VAIDDTTDAGELAPTDEALSPNKQETNHE
jgi:hypothetical protein